MDAKIKRGEANSHNVATFHNSHNIQLFGKEMEWASPIFTAGAPLHAFEHHCKLLVVHGSVGHIPGLWAWGAPEDHKG